LRSILITEFDARNAPPSLQPLAWLIGIWRSEHGGKAIFPTIPKFTYGEQVEIAVSDSHMTGLKALNYSYVFYLSIECNLYAGVYQYLLTIHARLASIK
uniref:THAP4_heme-bd domain-containing protein n=1 Tax=Ascaris lumbricoides TaxID=6252 RepID=A0A0M3HH18_ASCLU